MTALKLAAEESQPIKSRPSVCLNMVTNGTMRDEYNEAVAKVQDLIAQLHIQNTLAAELKLHLLVAGILECD